MCMVDQLKWWLCQINKYLTVLPRSSRKQSLRQGIKCRCFIWVVMVRKKESEAQKDAKQCKVMDFLTEPERHTGWHECSLTRLDFLWTWKEKPFLRVVYRKQEGECTCQTPPVFCVPFIKSAVGADSSTLLIIISLRSCGISSKPKMEAWLSRETACWGCHDNHAGPV